MEGELDEAREEGWAPFIDAKRSRTGQGNAASDDGHHCRVAVTRGRRAVNLDGEEEEGAEVALTGGVRLAVRGERRESARVGFGLKSTVGQKASPRSVSQFLVKTCFSFYKICFII